MSNFDKIFGADRDAGVHPKLRFWKQQMARPDVREARCEIWREGDVLGYKSTKLFVHFYGEDVKELQLDETDWDEELNTGLLAMGVKAVSPENEAQRFSLSLRAALRPAERRFGDGYFNAVLVEWVKASEFANTEAALAVLKYVHANKPYDEGSSYEYCRQLIESAILSRGRELINELGYPRKDAEQILARALAQYLDERFSVSVGRALGWK